MTTTDLIAGPDGRPQLQSKHTEYAILVREIGWVISSHPGNFVVASVGDPTRIETTTEQDYAEAIARQLMGQYLQLGLPGMASAVLVVAREVITTYSEWDSGYSVPVRR